MGYSWIGPMYDCITVYCNCNSIPLDECMTKLWRNNVTGIISRIEDLVSKIYYVGYKPPNYNTNFNVDPGYYIINDYHSPTTRAPFSHHTDIKQTHILEMVS